MKISIKGLNKIELFYMLYNHIQKNTSFGKPEKALKDIQEANTLLIKKHKGNFLEFNFFCNLNEDEIDPEDFNRAYGAGVFEKIVNELKQAKDKKKPLIGMEGKEKQESKENKDSHDGKEGKESKESTFRNPKYVTLTVRVDDLSKECHPNIYQRKPHHKTPIQFGGFIEKVVPLDPWIQYRNEVILYLLNAVHDPIKKFRLPMTAENYRRHLYYAWHLGDEREGPIDEANKELQGIHFRFPCTYRAPIEDAFSFPDGWGKDENQNPVKVRELLENFSEEAIQAGFTKELIQEFNQSLRGGDPGSEYQFCYSIVDQKFLNKIFLIAEAYYQSTCNLLPKVKKSTDSAALLASFKVPETSTPREIEAEKERKRQDEIINALENEFKALIEESENWIKTKEAKEVKEGNEAIEEGRYFYSLAIRGDELANRYNSYQVVSPSKEILLSKSFQWHARAASCGIKDAIYQVAMRYKEGIGCQVNDGSAFACFERLVFVDWPEPKIRITNQFPKAMYELGLCYAEGRGAVENPTFAIELFEQALAAGYKEAQKALDICHKAIGKHFAEGGAYKALTWDYSLVSVTPFPKSSLLASDQQKKNKNKAGV